MLVQAFIPKHAAEQIRCGHVRHGVALFCRRSPRGSQDSHNPCDGMMLRYAFVDDVGDIADDVTP